MKYSNQEKRKAFYELPTDIREAITSVDLSKKIQIIGKRYALHIDKIGELSDEIILVMHGLVSIKDFIDNIKKRIQLPNQKIYAIAKDINKEIFLPIRELMMESTEKPEIKTRQEQKPQKPKEIHHTPLNESEEIKKQIKERQAVKPVGTPPPNLPTGVTTPPSSAKQNLGEQTESKDEQKKPSHVDPYREPIE
jgi:hypothetical protein